VTRLVIAWGGLFYAVELRARIRFEWLEPHSHLIDLVWFALVGLAVASATRRGPDATATPRPATTHRPV
jgi:hypothetical protein